MGETTTDLVYVPQRSGRPSTHYRIADPSRIPGYRAGSRTSKMRQCILDNPLDVTSAMLADASGAPRAHCSDYLWRAMSRGWVERVEA